ncbi:MAG: mechanosensitive ion channel domain-containing protein [Bacteroidota bacterium]
MELQLQESINYLIDVAIAYLPSLFTALLLLIIGFRVIRFFTHRIEKGMQKAGINDDLRPFLGSMIGVTLKILLIFSAAGIVGLETSSFVAVMAAAGFAVGLALQGSLSNFAAGVMILIFRPYRTGDLVNIEDQMGHVTEIQIFNTIITTLDNKTVIIPNATASSGIITNLSTTSHLRVDLQISMPYGEDFNKVEQILMDAVKATPKVLESPEPMVGIETFDTHNIILAVRPYSNTEDYWDVYFQANKNIKKALSDNNIKVAYSEGIELGPIGK